MRVYKQVGRFKLTAHLFLPERTPGAAPLPVVAFFHGGGWVDGTPLWGYPWCQHLYERGLAAVSFAYRLVNQQTVTPLESIQDARSAIRWLRAHAAELGLDPARVVASGFSAGGYLAACAALLDSSSALLDASSALLTISSALLDDCDDPSDDLQLSARPDALLLISTPVDICTDAWFMELLDGRMPCQDLSPASQVRPGLPPSAFFQAGQDDMVPYASVAQFVEQMRQAGNRCELFSYPESDHFLGGPESPLRLEIVERMAQFLISLGYPVRPF